MRMGYNPFMIRDYKNFGNFDPSRKFENLFHSQQKEQKKETQESMNRSTMSNKDFMEMVPIRAVVLIFSFLFGTNKAVNMYVQWGDKPVCNK